MKKPFPVSIPRGPFPPAADNPDNPKDKFGKVKPCVSLIPPVAILAEALVAALGAHKYGPFNWREKPVNARTYADAAMRHLQAWLDGDELDDESRVSHLAHVRSCMAILIDAQSTGNMIDDRFKTSHGVRDFIAAATRPVPKT